jgi:uncharacterized protein (DUF3084 family)
VKSGEPMTDDVLGRLAQLEDAVRRAADVLGRLREENDRLRRDLARLASERKQMLAQVDSILHDIGKLDL